MIKFFNALAKLSASFFVPTMRVAMLTSLGPPASRSLKTQQNNLQVDIKYWFLIIAEQIVYTTIFHSSTFYLPKLWDNEH